MKSTHKLPIVAAGAVLLIMGGTWFFLPSLQSGQSKVEWQARVHVERARRLLDRYNAELSYRSLVLDQLRDAEIGVDSNDAGQVAERVGDDYQAAHTKMWTEVKPMEWKDGVGREAKPSYGNLSGQIRDGFTARSALVKENVSLLDDAMKEIEAALQVQAGNASGADYAEALRLKGVALFHRGVSEQVAARVKREDIDPLLGELDDLTMEAEQIKSMEGLLADSHIDEQIGKTREELSKGEARVAAAQSELSKLETTIRDLEKRVAAAQERSKNARAEMDRLREAGVNFSDPQGASTFARKLGEQNVVYRAALKETQELQAGSLPKAEIDITGDFLRGKYLEDGGRTLTVQPGLHHYQGERATLSRKIELEQSGIEAIRGDLARLENDKKLYEAQKESAARRLPEIQKKAGEVFEGMSRADSEAEAIEERGLKFLDQSLAASQQAANLAEKWSSEGRDNSANLSPEAKERSADNNRSQASWISGFVSAQVADAKSAKAWIYFDRYNAANRIASTLQRLTDQVALREVDLAAPRAKADAAKAASVKEVESAMAALEKAYKNTERHWTLTAQGAGITYLMVLLGNEDYLADTVEGYRNAIKGRENDRSADPFVTRLHALEARIP